ncbi:Chitin synthase C [Penicillium sp. IBT 18751x]|uniref:Chitin synthase C n=1 Tax=Penicillium maclennaniae TaxID=1343394 RepID=UPI0025403036|nr:Chitin synthase C [Penicillium maclennaniae]KAJ5665172.1 Chitin synthase C [Penicillium maclennaniae]KAJ6107492.1 Chitin synthase C [Penicillium sp. IBT 18751x]
MTTTKQFFSTSSPWEARFGYYRAVRRGQLIYVAGSTAADPNSPPDAPRVRFPGDARQQTHVILGEIIQAIQAVGGQGAESIVRCKMFVSRKEDCDAVGEGFRDVLGKENGDQIGAAATMIVVANGFVDDDMLVEIEVDAVAE